MSTQAEGAGRVRTSDVEREQVAAILRAAVSEGRLSLEEGDERLARVYAAKYRDELEPLTTDLPDGGWDGLSRTPEALAGVRHGLFRHGALVAVAAAVLVGLWLLSGAHFFWPLLPLAFLVIGFLRHRAFVRFGGRWGRGWGRGPWGHGPWGRGPWGRGPWGYGPGGPGPWGRGYRRGPWGPGGPGGPGAGGPAGWGAEGPGEWGGPPWARR
jgi:Domain of unknown function (DUF1707)